MTAAKRAARVEGVCDAAFAGVRAAFAENLDQRGEIGAAVCVHVNGRLVADLWGGMADPARGIEWSRDTLVNAYSTGKGLLAMLALDAVERGLCRLDAPVAAIWPEFAVEGKSQTTLRMLLAHRAGLPSVRKRLPAGAMYDWDWMCEALAGQAPWWPPGEAHGYHVGTYGFLVGEVLRRATGRPIGALLQERLIGDLGVDYHWGLPRALHPRVAPIQLATADMTFDEPARWPAAFPPTGDPEHDKMIWHAYFNPSGLSGMGTVNTTEWRDAVIPSTNGHGNARALAALYQRLLGGGHGTGGHGSGGHDAGGHGAVGHGTGGRASGGSGAAGHSAAGRGAAPLLSAELLAEATRVHSDGEDRVLGRPSRFGLGFQLAQPGRPLGPHPEAFGHYGYGGSLGFTDPVGRVAFGFVTNLPGDRWQTPRTQALVDAVYASF